MASIDSFDTGAWDLLLLTDELVGCSIFGLEVFLIGSFLSTFIVFFASLFALGIGG